ncbi:MAG: substrate-binding domain-containing protein [Ruminococcus sp.]|nr:substrate-binding domain-containing protein [Ruminococcus sp.]
MIGNKKIIAVCVTKLHTVGVIEYICRLQKRVSEAGYKLMVFNSTTDFYRKDSNDVGAAAVYKIINYSVIDALVIYCENFRSEEIPRALISEAKKHSVPVVLLKGTEEGCHSVINEYTDGFKKLIEHIVCDHGITDTCFIAGNRENDPDSMLRIACYREVLWQNGIEFSEDNVEYGGYWNIPACQALYRILKKRGRPPRAIICANDFMAIAVCDELVKLGYKVPEDVVVTGFDGIPEAEYYLPRLTTCEEDFDSFAAQTVDLLNEIFAGADCTLTRLNKFRPHFSESCGCPTEMMNARKAAMDQFGAAHDSHAHEDFVYEWLDRALDTRDMSSLTSILPDVLISGSYLCLNSDFIMRALDDEQKENDRTFTERLEVIGSKYSDNSNCPRNIGISEMLPDAGSWLESDSACIFASVYSGREVYGYYLIKSDDLKYDSHRINRLIKALNISFNSLVGFYRQKMMLVGLRTAAFTDQVTGLPNLKGATEWFDEFSADPENHRKCMSVSVYAIPDYKFIYENYGIKEIEETLCFIAEALKHSNNDKCFIGYVAEGEFMVINYYDSADEIAPTINSATSRFYGILNEYRSSRSEYFVEVNAGCIEAHEGWDGTFASFYKLAGNEMYLNRLNANTERTVNKTKLPVDIYKRFELLVEKNLFAYHFQPIVDAYTGEIVAYEALMRPDKSINMDPGQVIQVAEEYGRLYDIEKATLFNVLGVLADSPESFRGRKVFINSIPGFFLKGSDYDNLLR